MRPSAVRRATMQRFEPGKPLLDQITAARLNQMQDEIERRTPQRGAGTTLTQYGNGFSYSSDAAASVTFSPPLKIRSVGDLLIEVKAGTVENLSLASITPTINGTAIDAATPPQLATTGGHNIYLRFEIEPNSEGPYEEDDLGGFTNEIYQLGGTPLSVTSVAIVSTSDTSDARFGAVQLFGGTTQSLIQYVQIGTVSGAGVPSNTAYGPISATWTPFSTFYAQFGASYQSGAQLAIAAAQYVPA